MLAPARDLLLNGIHSISDQRRPIGAVGGFIEWDGILSVGCL